MDRPLGTPWPTVNPWAQDGPGGTFFVLWDTHTLTRCDLPRNVELALSRS